MTIGSVVIDCFPESAPRYRERCAVIAIDVIRATTTATTALSMGRRVFPARTSDEAAVLASRLNNPLLVGELGGNMVYGFDETNSPATIANRADVERPMILVSSSGTQLVLDAVGADVVYLACLRNFSAVARFVAGRHSRIAVIGAGTRGVFRREDQIGCARVAEQLIELGYFAENQETEDCIARWRGVSYEDIRGGRSADYLRRSGQEQDLEYVLAHIDDVDTVPALADFELVDAVRAERQKAAFAAMAFGQPAAGGVAVAQ
jgi:2-phosphosulfolactate phosphatase